MIKNKELFLKELALTDELADNVLALVFAFNPGVDISKKEKLADNLFSFYGRYKPVDRQKISIESSEMKTLDQWVGKDLRLTKLRLKNVRGFPDNSKPFGIEFSNDKGQPQSMIILGGNGCGKSSLFGSLEYTFCKKVGEARLRTNEYLQEDAEAFGEFLEHFGNGFTNAYCVVNTVSETMTLQGMNIPKSVRNKINPQTHFISDCDIYDYCKLSYHSGHKNSFHNLVAQSLGLKDLLDFETHLNTFINYRRRTELDKVKALENSIVQEEELIRTNANAILEKQQRVKQIQEQSSQLPVQQSKAPEVLAKLKLKSFEFKNNYTQFKNAIEHFRESYKQVLLLGNQSHTLTQIQFLKLGLELAKNNDDCPLCGSSKKPKEELLDYLQEKLNEIEAYNDANQLASKTLNLAKEELETLINNLQLFRTNLVSEFTEIRALIEFSDLTSKHSEAQLVIDSHLANEFFSLAKNAEENAKSTPNAFQYFDSFFDVTSEFVDNNLNEFLLFLQSYNQERKDLLNSIELAIRSQPATLNATEQLAVLNNEITTLADQIKKLEVKISSYRSDVDNLRLTISQFNKVKDDAKQFVAVYHTKLNEEVQSGFRPIQSIVMQVLNRYLSNDERNIELKISIEPEITDPETGEVLSEIIVAKVVQKDKPDQTCSVNKYFNTFHYRLFATMVGISVAIASRITTRINLPLVLDDIFYASDFENRTSIEGFLEQVFASFEQFTADMPLQLIMFTHDQLVFETLINIHQKQPDTIGFAKMFPYKEAKEKEDYMDLIYKYPYHLPKSILNHLIKYVA